MLIRISHDDTERRALVRLPAKPTGKVPAVLTLHGTGGTAHWTEEETQLTALARVEGFAAIYPEALPPRPDRLPKFLTNPPMWNDLSPRSREHPLHPDDVGFISKLLDHLINEYGIDSERIYVTGFSNGAGMTFRLGNELCERFRAIAPIAGLCRFDPRPSRPVPTLYLIGDADPLIPLEGGFVRTPWRYSEVKPSVWETLAMWSRAVHRTDLEPSEHEQESVRWLDYGSNLQVGIIRGLGHHWPGGKGRLSEKYAGRPLPCPDASRLVWEFFRAH